MPVKRKKISYQEFLHREYEFSRAPLAPEMDFYETIRSGNLGNTVPTYRSVLRATARAAGTLSFTLGDLGWNNYSVFTPPGGDPVSFSSLSREDLLELIG